MGTETECVILDITYDSETHNHLATIVWWPRIKYKSSRAELSKLQRLTCLGTKRTMIIARTGAVEVLLALFFPSHVDRG
jgi:hypothetical protein